MGGFALLLHYYVPTIANMAGRFYLLLHIARISIFLSTLARFQPNTQSLVSAAKIQNKVPSFFTRSIVIHRVSHTFFRISITAFFSFFSFIYLRRLSLRNFLFCAALTLPPDLTSLQPAKHSFSQTPLTDFSYSLQRKYPFYPFRVSTIVRRSLNNDSYEASITEKLST